MSLCRQVGAPWTLANWVILAFLQTGTFLLNDAVSIASFSIRWVITQKKWLWTVTHRLENQAAVSSDPAFCDPDPKKNPTTLHLLIKETQLLWWGVGYQNNRANPPTSLHLEMFSVLSKQPQFQKLLVALGLRQMAFPPV